MNLPIYFHCREADIPEHTYCIDVIDNELFVGYSVVHAGDTFNKKTGRNIATNRMTFSKTKMTVENIYTRVHPAITETLSGVVDRVKEIMKIDQHVTIYVSCVEKSLNRRCVLKIKDTEL